MKKIMALILALLMLATMVACGGEAADVTTTASATEEVTSTLPSADVQGGYFDDDDEDTDIGEGYDPTATTGPIIENPIEVPTFDVVTNTTTLEGKGLRYVMIYNPNIYDDNAEVITNNLSTGDLGMQIEVGMNRADGLEEPEENTDITIDQGQLSSGLPVEDVYAGGGRAGGFAPVYKKGSTRQFYVFNEDLTMRYQANFECRYAGEYCYIWVYNKTITDAYAQETGETFDRDVYEQTVALFGEPRYADAGGKINLLYYPMQDGLGGFFYLYDLLASDEIYPNMVAKYGINTDHAIININSTYAMNPAKADFMKGVTAHEFQHLICATDAFYGGQLVRSSTWFNEAMSGFVEEYLFPGTKINGGHFVAFHLSDYIRHGQSLYNFYNDSTDVGVYGSVHLFSEYVARLSTEEVFFKYHDYWRTNLYEQMTTAEALANAMPETVVDEIYGSFYYPSSVRFDNEYDEFMSKLTLQFYLELLDREDTDPAIYDEIVTDYLIYDTMDEAMLEGGGRIIVALQDDTFQIPKNADSGLIYVGLNKDFEVVTPLVFK